MTPLSLLVLFMANLVALVVSLSVWLLAFWQRSRDALGRSVLQFLAVVGVFNLAVLMLILARLLALPPIWSSVITNVTVTAFAFSVVGGFSLVIALAGMMKQAWQLIARVGVTSVIVLQWPLWYYGFFMPGTGTSSTALAMYSPVGQVAAVLNAVYIVLTFAAAWQYRRRIGHPGILAGLLLLLASQALTLYNPTLRELDISSLVSVVASAVLGYNLMRMRLFGPLMMQNAQLQAVKAVALGFRNGADRAHSLASLARHARQLLHTGIVVILLPKDENTLCTAIQDGGPVNLLDTTVPIGDGLNGRVYETQQPMRLQSYRAWDGRLPGLDFAPLYASLSVPLVYRYDVVGVLSVHEIEPGRLFTDEDQEALELLASLAAVAIVTTSLEQRT